MSGLTVTAAAVLMSSCVLVCDRVQCFCELLVAHVHSRVLILLCLQADGVRRVLHAITLHDDQLTIVERSLTVLCAIVRDGRAHTVLPSGTHPIAAVRTAMTKHAESDVVASKGCRLLSRLVSGSDSEHATPCIAMALRCMDGFLDYADVQEEACALILALTKLPSVKAAVKASSAAEYVRRARDRHVIAPGLAGLATQV